MRAFPLLLVFAICGVTRLTHAQSPTPTPQPPQLEQPAPHQPADAESKSQAERYFLAGVSLQKTEDFEAAIAAYETSVRLYPTKSALFNLANCQRAQHRYADAWSSLQRLHAEFGRELVEPMLSTSKAQLDELENLTALLSVTSHPTGAAVEIDGQPQDATPWQTPVRLTIGKHTIQVSLDGYTARANTVELKPRQSLVETFQLEAAPKELLVEPPVTRGDASTSGPKAPTIVTTTPQQPLRDTQTNSSHWPTVGWASLTLGAVGLAVGANVGLRALEVNQRLTDVCEAGHCAAGQAPQIARLDRLTTTANVWIGAGAVLLVTGTTLVLWPVLSGPDQEVSVHVNPTGLLVQGNF